MIASRISNGVKPDVSKVCKHDFSSTVLPNLVRRRFECLVRRAVASDSCGCTLSRTAAEHGNKIQIFLSGSGIAWSVLQLKQNRLVASGCRQLEEETLVAWGFTQLENNCWSEIFLKNYGVHSRNLPTILKFVRARIYPDKLFWLFRSWPFHVCANMSFNVIKL